MAHRDLQKAPAAMTAPVLIEDNEVIRGALRKAALRLIPLIGLGYGAAYMDRVNISFAALHMNQDLHFSATVYGFGAGLFFLSYAACEVPSNMLLLRFGARRWLARIMFSWGLLAMAMMLVKTPRQFYLLRFLLGMAEAGYFPAVVYYLMQWFPPQMRARAISRFYISLPLSSTAMGAIAGALLKLNGLQGLAGWQWLFLVEGLPPLILGFLFLRFLPDTPNHARWLNHTEKLAILESIAADARASDGAHSEDIAKSLGDPRLWLFAGYTFFMLATMYAFQFSAPLLIRDLTGFSDSRIGFVVAGTGLAGAISMLVNGAHSDRRNERYLHVIVPCLLVASAYLAGALSKQAWIAIPAFYVATTAHFAMQGPGLAIPAEFLKGRAAAIGYATINTVGITGGFIGPYWMGIAKDLTGTYQRGLMSVAVFSLCAATCMAFLQRSSLVGSAR